ncbi:MAG: hypothetical protein H0V38_05345, partial [Sporichthyaceae bacterium]|nr:hypothetical protein [Sporichthyaceae bacterium]
MTLSRTWSIRGDKIIVAAPSTPAHVVPGRQTASYGDDLVVFLIGMRVNR